jgi:CHASE2 domain-containing sensor protein
MNISSKWELLVLILSFLILDISSVLFSQQTLSPLIFTALLFIGFALLVYASFAKVK